MSHSTPEPGAVGWHVQRDYDVGRVRRCTLLRAFTNDVYRVDTDEGAYIAKVFRRSWRSHGDVLWEANLQCQGHLAGGPTPPVILTRSGGLISALAAPEGERWCLLQAEAPGEKPAKPFTADLYRRFGETAGRLHAAFDQAEVVAPDRKARTLDALLLDPLALIEPLFAGLPREDWRFVADLAQTIHAHLNAIGTSLDWGICHGDLSLDNAGQTGSGELILYDFDLAAPSYRAADFFGVQMSQPVEHWQAFVAGYRRHRPISDRDTEAVPWFVPAWTIWSLAHDATHRVHWHGRWIVGRDQIAMEVASLHEWVERHR